MTPAQRQHYAHCTDKEAHFSVMGKHPRMRRGTRRTVQRAVWLLRLIAAVLAFTPIPLFMMWFNYTVDRSGLFQGQQFERDVASMLLEGNHITGYEKMDERQISALLVRQMDKAPNTVALGSSRILQMDRHTAGTEDFFNFGMVGADFYDVLGTFYLFVKEDKLPQNVIIGLDPWLLNDSEDAIDYRSDKNLYAEFLAEELGIDAEYAEEDKEAKWKALTSPSYFQGNMEYYLRDRDLRKMPTVVESPDEYENNITEIKCNDGSVRYTSEMRNWTQEEVNTIAYIHGTTFLRCGDYSEPSQSRALLLKQFLNYVQSKGVNVYVVLTPYHPTTMGYVLTNPEAFTGFLQTEQLVRRVCAETNVPVYGSYYPFALPGVDETDFADGIHCKTTCIAKFWPGITQAQLNREAGVVPADSLLMPPDEVIYQQVRTRCGKQRAEDLRFALGLQIADSAA